MARGWTARVVRQGHGNSLPSPPTAIDRRLPPTHCCLSASAPTSRAGRTGRPWRLRFWTAHGRGSRWCSPRTLAPASRTGDSRRLIAGSQLVPGRTGRELDRPRVSCCVCTRAVAALRALPSNVHRAAGPRPRAWVRPRARSCGAVDSVARTTSRRSVPFETPHLDCPVPSSQPKPRFFQWVELVVSSAVTPSDGQAGLADRIRRRGAPSPVTTRWIPKKVRRPNASTHFEPRGLNIRSSRRNQLVRLA